jgi:hypothetical protein
VFATKTGCAFCKFGAKLNMLDSTAIRYIVGLVGSFRLSLFSLFCTCANKDIIKIKYTGSVG